MLLQPLGGAFARVEENATPLGRRGAPWHWQAPAAWLDPARDGAALHWSDTVCRAALVGHGAPRACPWAAGETYPNFLPGRDPARLRAAYGPAASERLRALRADWDRMGSSRDQTA